MMSDLEILNIILQDCGRQDSHKEDALVMKLESLIATKCDNQSKMSLAS